MRDAALQRAIDAAHGTANLAREIGVTSQAISQWERCPIERAKQVEDATGVPRHELRPDIFDMPVEAAE